MVVFIYQLVDIVARILVLVIIVDAVLSYFMSPYHPVRVTMGRFLTPLYTPIRRLIKPMGGIDFSPLILLILIQVIAAVIKNLLLTMR